MNALSTQAEQRGGAAQTWLAVAHGVGEGEEWR